MEDNIVSYKLFRVAFLAIALLMIFLDRVNASAQSMCGTLTSGYESLAHVSSTGKSSASDRVDVSQLIRFGDAMQYLAVSQKIAIVAESRPLHDQLSPQQIDALTRDLAVTTLDDGEVLAKVATAYDYSVTRNADGVYLLSKRYTDPEDLPYVTDGEAVADYQAILTRIKDFTTADFGPTSSPSQANIQQQLGSTFTADQRMQLAKGLPVDQLTPEQSGLLWDAAYTHYVFMTAKGIESLILYLKALHSPEAKFQNIYCPPLGLSMFGMVGPFAANRTCEYGFGYGAVGTPGSPGMLTAPNGTVIGLGLFSRVVPDAGSVALIRKTMGNYMTSDPDAPTEADRAVVALDISSHPNTISLGEFVRALNETPPQTSGSAAIYEVIPELAIKPISPFGVQSLSPVQRLRAAGDVYGLRLIQPKRNEWRLTTPTASPLKSVADLPTCLTHLFPLPWQHACQTTFTLEFAREQKAIDALPPKERMPVDTYRARSLGKPQYYHSVTRRLRAIVEPRLGLSATGSLLVSQSPPEVLRLLTLMTLSRFVIDMAAEPAPPYLVDFSKQVVTGSVSDTGEIQRLSVGSEAARFPTIIFTQPAKRVIPVPGGGK